eukprot:COSAG01_NODE_71168_length_256_cov_1.974522_1_plen_46_part_10
MLQWRPRSSKHGTSDSDELSHGSCAAKIWDYASPIMLLKIAIIMLL